MAHLYPNPKPQTAKCNKRKQETLSTNENESENQLKSKINKLMSRLEESKPEICDEDPLLKSCLHELRSCLDANATISTNPSLTINGSETEEGKAESKIAPPNTVDEMGSAAVQHEEHPDPDPRRIQSVVEALSNTVVLKSIFSKSSAQNLLQFRLVNSKWNEVSCYILETKMLVKVNLNMVFNDSDETSDEESLKLLGIPGKLPCCAVKLRLCLAWTERELALHLLESLISENHPNPIDKLWNDLQPKNQEEPENKKDQEIKENARLKQFKADFKLLLFIQKFGKKIKFLDAKFDYVNLCSETVGDLFISKMPNLVHLKLYSDCWYKQHDHVKMREELEQKKCLLKKDSRPLYFPFLVKYEHAGPCNYYDNYTDTIPLIETVLNAAPNLKDFYNFLLWMTPMMIRTEKWSTIRTFTMIVSSVDDLEKWMVFVKQLGTVKLRLECLWVKDVGGTLPIGAPEAITKFLESSKNTLVSLRLPALELNPELNLPEEFPNLKFLAVSSNERIDRVGCAKIFPEGYFPTRSDDGGLRAHPFPQVEAIQIELPSLSLKRFRDALEDNLDEDEDEDEETECGLFPTVKCLQLKADKYGLSAPAGEFIARNFPNLTAMVFLKTSLTEHSRSSHMGIEFVPESVEVVDFMHCGVRLKRRTTESRNSWDSIPYSESNCSIISDYYKYTSK